MNQQRVSTESLVVTRDTVWRHSMETVWIVLCPSLLKFALLKFALKLEELLS